jgi:plastocyanin
MATLLQGVLVGMAVVLGSNPVTAQQCATIHDVEITFEGAQGFKPRDLTIKAGDCVRWTNRTNIEHSAVAVDRSFHTGQLMPGNANVVKFETPGEVAYTCGPHPPMVGKIIVAP